MPGFTHLHVASGFSTRYGASHPEALAERAAERGMDALALTDRDTVAGAVRFAEACARAGIRPVFGAGLAVPYAEPDGTRVRRRIPVRGGAFVDESAPRALFLARDGAVGWAALCRLLSAAHLGGGAALPGWADLTGEGLTVLLGPDSEVGRELAAGRPDRAARLTRALAGEVRRRAAPRSGLPRPAGHRARLAAARRPHRSASPPTRAYARC